MLPMHGRGNNIMTHIDDMEMSFTQLRSLIERVGVPGPCMQPQFVHVYSKLSCDAGAIAER